jgi:hypothetical protein
MSRKSVLYQYYYDVSTLQSQVDVYSLLAVLCSADSRASQSYKCHHSCHILNWYGCAVDTNKWLQDDFCGPQREKCNINISKIY